MLQDLRYAVRFLARRRGFTFVAVLTLAVGVGVNAAIFSMADSVLFRPLPYAHRDRLFVLEPALKATGQRFGTTRVENLDAARGTGALDAIIDLDYVTSVFVREGDRVQPLRVQPVPAEYLDVLGVSPVYGRGFHVDDADGAVLLTYRFWRTRYGGNPAAVGGTIATVDGRSLLVVGVLPPSFRTASATAFFSQPDLLMASTLSYVPGARASTPVVRLAPGITREEAAARLAAVSAIEVQPGDTRLSIVPLREAMARTSSPTLILLCAIALLVLLVGCANLANLVLARGAERTVELSVRASLGASRWRIVRLLLVESLLVAALGGAAGIAVAYWSFRWLVVALPASLARTTAPVFDARVLVFAVAAAVAAGLLSSVPPAWRLARADMKAGLGRGRLHTHPLRTGPKTLLALEVGFALVAVIAAVILAHSLSAMVTKELGFDAGRLLVRTRSVGAGAAQRSRETRLAELIEQLAAIRRVPGTRAAAATSTLPASGAAPEFRLFSREDGRRGGGWSVSSGFFRTMGIPISQGREFEDRESFDNAPVAILNASAARLLFAGGDPLGHVVRAPNQPARGIVGVVADARQSWKAAAEPAIYVPFDRTKFRTADMIVDGPDAPAYREQLHAAILQVSRDSDIRIEAIAAVLDRDVAVLRFTMRVIGAFAILTVLLAMLGVYGVISFIAGERLREYGVRIALGASGRAIAALVLRHALLPVAAGLATGLVAGAWSARLLAAQILDVAPANATTFIAAAAALLMCGALAAAVPARRATKVDPMIALRAE